MKEPSSQAETLELICILDDSFYQHHLFLNGLQSSSILACKGTLKNQK